MQLVRRLYRRSGRSSSLRSTVEERLDLTFLSGVAEDLDLACEREWSWAAAGRALQQECVRWPTLKQEERSSIGRRRRERKAGD